MTNLLAGIASSRSTRKLKHTFSEDAHANNSKRYASFILPDFPITSQAANQSAQTAGWGSIIPEQTKPFYRTQSGSLGGDN